MNQAIETVKNVLTNLSEMQPALNIVGMREEASAVQDMRNDLKKLLNKLSGDTPEGLRRDAMSAFVALESVIENSDPNNEDELHYAFLAAENFVLRMQNYRQICNAHGVDQGAIYDDK